MNEVLIEDLAELYRKESALEQQVSRNEECGPWRREADPYALDALAHIQAERGWQVRLMRQQLGEDETLRIALEAVRRTS